MHGGNSYATVFGFINRPFSPVLGRTRSIACVVESQPTDLEMATVGIALILLCWVALSVVVGAVLDFARLRSMPKSESYVSLPHVLFLIGFPAYVGCSMLHLCIGGHMQHPPYGAAHYAMDVFWVVLFLMAATRGYAARIHWSKAWFWAVLMLIVLRFPFGSYYGLAGIIEGSVSIFLLILTLSSFGRLLKNAYNRIKTKHA